VIEQQAKPDLADEAYTTGCETSSMATNTARNLYDVIQSIVGILGLPLNRCLSWLMFQTCVPLMQTINYSRTVVRVLTRLFSDGSLGPSLRVYSQQQQVEVELRILIFILFWGRGFL